MGSIGLIIVVLIVTGVVWLVMTNFSFSSVGAEEDDDDEEEFELPLQDVFYEFNHESTKAWLKWIDGQNESKKQFAYDMLVDYLELPPKKLGAITGDVVRAIVVFKKKTDAFDVLVKLIKKTRDHYPFFRSVDMFYEPAVIGLTKMDHEKAEKFLASELNEVKYREDLLPIQKYIIRALCNLEFNPNLEKVYVRILANHEYHTEVKKELLEYLESKADTIRERIFSKILNDQIDATTSTMNENDKFIIEQVFYKLKRLITKADYDEKIWHAMSLSCDSTRMGEMMIKLLADMISFEDESLSQNQLLELIGKKEPARTRFIDACARKYRLSESEKELLRVPIRPEDLVFERTKFNTEKSKKTKSVAAELLGDYHYMEKMLLANESGKSDKSSAAISLIMGSGESEKFYISRAFAANHNKTFIYVDCQQILHADGMVKEFKNHVANIKPCLVYLDKLDRVLNVDLEKREANNLKTITRTVKDLSILPSITFIANIPFSKDALQKNNPQLLTKFSHSASNLYHIAMTKEKPGEKDRKRLLQQYIDKIDVTRMQASENFTFDDLVEYTNGMDTIELLVFLQKFFEISLIANGRLISLQEFTSRWQAAEPIKALSSDEESQTSDEATAETSNESEVEQSTEQVAEVAELAEADTAELGLQ